MQINKEKRTKDPRIFCSFVGENFNAEIYEIDKKNDIFKKIKYLFIP